MNRVASRSKIKRRLTIARISRDTKMLGLIAAKLGLGNSRETKLLPEARGDVGHQPSQRDVAQIT